MCCKHTRGSRESVLVFQLGHKQIFSKLCEAGSLRGADELLFGFRLMPKVRIQRRTLVTPRSGTEHAVDCVELLIGSRFASTNHGCRVTHAEVVL